MIERCGFSVERMSRICDEPATHVYHGIGGRQPCCDEHADYLRRKWGIKPTPLPPDNEPLVLTEQEIRDLLERERAKRGEPDQPGDHRDLEILEWLLS